MLIKSRLYVYGVGTTLKQHWVKMWCFLGHRGVSQWMIQLISMTILSVMKHGRCFNVVGGASINYTLSMTVPFATKQTQDIELILLHCWATVFDAGPKVNQHWSNVSCLLGRNSNNKDTITKTVCTIFGNNNCENLISPFRAATDSYSIVFTLSDCTFNG